MEAKGVQIDLISEDILSAMDTGDKIRLILDGVQMGNVIVLEKGLTPDEEAKLIQTTMTEISAEDFSGIEIESYPDRMARPTWVDRVLGRRTVRNRLTVIGPANKMKTVKRDRDHISTVVYQDDKIPDGQQDGKTT